MRDHGVLLSAQSLTWSGHVPVQDEEAVLRGAAEVHAALAALLYTERPSLRLRAEEEWTLANTFDKRYSDVEWVRVTRHWPPKAVKALQRFLSFS